MRGARPFLVVTASPERSAAVARLLRPQDQAPVEALAPEALLERARAGLPSAVFLDSSDAPPDPFGLCRRLRRGAARARCAIVLFGTAADPSAFVKALDAGADDYWPFPFNEPVCRAYLRSILRRVSAAPSEPKRTATADIQLVPDRCEALLKGRPVRLRAKEFDILYHLASRAGEVVSREELLKAVWGFEDYGNSRAIDFHISQLRRKLGALASRLETVPGSGYSLRAGASHRNLT